MRPMEPPILFFPPPHHSFFSTPALSYSAFVSGSALLFPPWISEPLSMVTATPPYPFSDFYLCLPPVPLVKPNHDPLHASPLFLSVSFQRLNRASFLGTWTVRVSSPPLSPCFPSSPLPLSSPSFEHQSHAQLCRVFFVFFPFAFLPPFERVS